MKALYYEKYGSTDGISIREIPKPELLPGYVRVNVVAASINPLDWRLLRADPLMVRFMNGFFKPKQHGLGADFSGVVESIAADVSLFKPGDAVFGIMTPNIVGSFAEYVSIPEVALVSKPATLSHAHASTLGIAALTAYEGIHDYQRLKSGDHVLINGASGGVGTFAVQMAKALGAHVTAVCSARNHELVRSIGADAVIDYQNIDITRIDARFDLVFDAIGNHAPRRMKRLLREGGRLVLASAANSLGFLNAIVLSGRKREPIKMIVDLKKDKQRLEAVLRLVEEGKVEPVIDREFPFSQVAQAIDYVATKHARGKVVIHIADSA